MLIRIAPHTKLIMISCLAASLACILAGCGGGANSDPASLAAMKPLTGYLTWKNDTARTGLQSRETILTPANVNEAQFGEKFSYPLDGWTYAQPLYVKGLSTGGAQRNVVFVATENDSVYAFDADNPGPPLWHTSFLGPGITVGPSPFPDGEGIITDTGGLGITSTPVIDPDSRTIYVEAETFENGAYAQKLHALDIYSGAEKPGSPVVISAAGFQPGQEFNRPALLLANGNVYVAFSYPYGDAPPYNGWLFAFDARSLRQVASWNDTPAGGEGGIWMAGSGPAADEDGNIYVATGNGTWNGATDFGMSVVKLDPTLHVLDYFTPHDEEELSAADQDFGSGGVLLVPTQTGAFSHEIIVGGKADPIYVLNRDSMGHKGASDDSQIIQCLDNQSGGEAGLHWYTTAAFFQQKVYFIGSYDVIKAFTLDSASGKLSSAPASKGSFVFPFMGAQPVVSSNGAADGIVWAVDGFNPAGSLRAFDAADVSRELYKSPPLGTPTKFSVPTVMNGKVYVATQNRLVVFGLKCAAFGCS